MMHEVPEEVMQMKGFHDMTALETLQWWNTENGIHLDGAKPCDVWELGEEGKARIREMNAASLRAHSLLEVGLQPID